MRNVLAMFACFGLTGCILPPVISYASMALDGVSYVATGKSVTDHALSAAVAEDCALLRVVSEQDVEAVCQEYAEGESGGIAVTYEAAAPPTDRHRGQRAQPAEIMLAAATPAEPPVELFVTAAGPTVESAIAAMEPPGELFVTAAGPTVESAIAPAEPPVNWAITATPEPLDPLYRIDPAKLPATSDSEPDSEPDIGVVAAPTTSAPAATNRKAIYLIVGSFRTVDRAERLAAQMPGITAAIAPALVGDDRYFRVVVGPYEPGETGDAKVRLAAIGIGDSWAANLCTGDLGAPPCDASP